MTTSVTPMASQESVNPKQGWSSALAQDEQNWGLLPLKEATELRRYQRWMQEASHRRTAHMLALGQWNTQESDSLKRLRQHVERLEQERGARQTRIFSRHEKRQPQEWVMEDWAHSLRQSEDLQRELETWIKRLESGRVPSSSVFKKKEQSWALLKQKVMLWKEQSESGLQAWEAQLKHEEQWRQWWKQREVLWVQVLDGCIKEAPLSEQSSWQELKIQTGLLQTVSQKGEVFVEQQKNGSWKVSPMYECKKKFWGFGCSESTNN